GPPCPAATAVLQVPARALLEGDTVTLRCRGWRQEFLTAVRFYHDGKDLGWAPRGTQLSLPPLELNHSGQYSCKAKVGFMLSPWEQSEPVTVTVH
ncbi:FCGR3 protein, partial [Pardalotus punctatus]|nr:FCGR3 protein [Pardalotus punctatus]